MAYETWERLEELTELPSGDAYQRLQWWKDNKVPDVNLINGITVEVGEPIVAQFAVNAISVEMPSPDIMIVNPDDFVVVDDPAL